jgi:hypothetical protein
MSKLVLCRPVSLCLIKAKAVPLHATKALGGEEVQFLLIHDVGTRWAWVVSIRPRPRISPGKGSPVPIGQETGWAPEPVWTQRLEEKSFRLSRESNLDRLVVQPLARHYTDWANQLTFMYNVRENYNTEEGIWSMQVRTDDGLRGAKVFV